MRLRGPGLQIQQPQCEVYLRLRQFLQRISLLERFKSAVPARGFGALFVFRRWFSCRSAKGPLFWQAGGSRLAGLRDGASTSPGVLPAARGSANRTRSATTAWNGYVQHVGVVRDDFQIYVSRTDPLSEPRTFI